MSRSAPIQRLQRSDGACRVSLEGEGRLASLFQSDPCRFFLPPRDKDDLACGLLLTTSGGIAGGDRLDLRFDWRDGARATVTTGAAEKIYRAGTSGPAMIDTHLAVGSGAHGEFLPQETILFRDAALRRHCRIDLAADCRFLATDMVVLGRAASGEIFDLGRMADRWSVYRDGTLVHFDALAFDAREGSLSHKAGFAGNRAFGFLLLAAPEGAALLDLARAQTVEAGLLCGATLVHDILLMRWLAPDGESLRKAVGKAVMALRGALGLPARLPRVWQ